MFNLQKINLLVHSSVMGNVPIRLQYRIFCGIQGLSLRGRYPVKWTLMSILWDNNLKEDKVSEPIKKEIREEILHKVKTTGLPVAKASEQYGVSTKTIYTWLSKDGEQNPSLDLVRKLKKRNQELLTIVGILTYELEKIKKGRR